MKHLLAATACLFAVPVFAAPPQPVPLPPPMPPVKDEAFPGTIKLAVDATDLDRHILTVRETIPVAAAGDLILLYPEWIPGHHGPNGPLPALASLVIEAGGNRVEWTRDLVNMHAFHVPVPQGATELDVSFQALTPPETAEGRVVMTHNIIDLAWNEVVLYPAGFFARGIQVAPSLKLPDGFGLATALETDGSGAFKAVPLDTLIDSPVFAGRYHARIDLAPGATVPVHLNLFGDRARDIAITDDQIEKHRALVDQAGKTFGSHHYAHYDFLFALSDELARVGLEHHQSSENALQRSALTAWDKEPAGRDLLPHEYTHSWNGKFRRPADLWAPNYDVPERDSLLWVYEGQTDYWGKVLAARAGLWNRQEALDTWALIAARIDTEPGRAWRSLQDTTNDPILLDRKPQAWSTWQRAYDYYNEAALMWLDADTLIREGTNGAKSLNDFARAFFGIDDGAYGEVTYDFDAIVQALNAVMPHDWAGFLRARLDGHGPGAPLDGLTRGGWRLVYTDQPSVIESSGNTLSQGTSFAFSIGLSLGKDGAVQGVVWNSPAWKAGLAKGIHIVAVNGEAFEGAPDLEAALKQRAPIDLMVRDGKAVRPAHIDYADGPRHPHLQRIDGTPDRLGDILSSLP